MSKTKCDVLQGTLDLMTLKTFEALGPLHEENRSRIVSTMNRFLSPAK
ncbi:MAG TPA: hypothetical protein VK574_19810 [Terracidiphilus sp.]|jgi:hypothetical protein|nr:hypothetical protein [Terracidiphilus sp.]